MNTIVNLILITLLMTGCANFEGVQINSEEAKACKSEGCAVFTERELIDFAKRFFNEGVKLGKESL